MKGIIRVGDITTGGGKVVAGSENMIFAGMPVARKGDRVTCPIPGHSPAFIVEGHPTMKDGGIEIAFNGYKCSCGCTLVSSLGIATTSK